MREAPVSRPGRKGLIREILRPLEDELDAPTLRRLELGLAMILGIESYIALNDIYGIEPDEIKEVWRFACKAMLAAAVSEAHGEDGRSGNTGDCLG